MKIWALVSWYDEKPEHLTELVESVALLCDGIVAVDGAYALYPNGKPKSPDDQHEALTTAARTNDLESLVVAPHETWAGGEVQKRARLFEWAGRTATPFEDWFIILDGDMLLDRGVAVEATREALAATSCDVAEVTFAELAYGSATHTIHATGFRSMFRAVPGLTVEGTHWLYVVPDDTRPGGRRFMWHGIVDGKDPKKWKYAPEPAADLTGEVCLLHRPHVRDRSRVIAREGYYQRREQAAAERVPTYGE